MGRHFEVLTDQRSVAFMFDQQHSSKIKNEKIMRWRLELANFKFDIIYRPDDIKTVTKACPSCNQLKPRFCKNEGQLIKATSAFERLNVDFKGPLPTTTKNRYLLTIVDEYSRFPFAFPCSDISTSTVIKVLTNVFSLFGTPAYIHSDRGTSFMSQELKSFLTSLGVAKSRTTAYNPQGNGQVERYNGIVWKTVLLALNSKGLGTERWEETLQPALHSIRSLLCTSTNATPHERMFNHPRRSFNGRSLPTWLTQPGPVLMKNNMRQSKYDPIVQEVLLIEANPDYAYVKLPDGRESSVSIRHLAPLGEPSTRSDMPSHDQEPTTIQQEVCRGQHQESEIDAEPAVDRDSVADFATPSSTMNTRRRQKPSYLKDYITF
ncbi:hypothetical protein JTE90_027736 [Oedothorax gibbosus]|uniref:Integrase catalytic domain-containing protein n=1 Tax=Oedothorax gibbosus TaxID=931172 RepID=A0AAV6UKI6_9ARAC|nr:hypothetical protein JTE90_027736 [Oedothorax gibbosus]